MLKRLWLLGILMLFISMAFAQDSTAYQGKAGIADVADEDPGLFMVMMIVLVGLITSIILGLIALSILAGLLVALAAGGILSFSVILGLYHKSLSIGIKTFVYVVAVLLGGLAGVIGYFLFSMVRHVHFQIQSQLLFSIAGGMAGGMLGGWIALWLLGKLYKRLKTNQHFNA